MPLKCMLFPLFPLSPERRDTLPCQTALTMALFDSPYEVATPRPSLAPHGQRQGPNFSLGFKAVPAAHTAPLLSQAAPQASGLPAEVPPSLPPPTPNAFSAPPHLPESWSPFKVKFRPHLFNEPLQDPSSCSVLSWAGAARAGQGQPGTNVHGSEQTTLESGLSSLTAWSLPGLPGLSVPPPRACLPRCST